MIKGCLFDLDGTLLDTLTSIRYYLNYVLKKHGQKEVTVEETKLFVGKGARNLVERALTAGGVSVSSDSGRELLGKIHREYVDVYDEKPEYLTSPYESISEAVDFLYERGIKLAVISNKPDKMVKKLVELNFPNRFDIVEGASEKYPLKPLSEWPLSICERLSLSPDEVLYFGDTSTDMQTAKNFGAALAVGVLWGFRDEEELLENGADVILSHPSEIIKLLK
ncbi:MAG: HAD family hydrolase [Clostridia bacterium]|nr:HAD family hydrolase [Clostridia bacterium]